MPDAKDIEKRICELLDMGDEQLLAELERSLLLSDERHRRIDDTLEAMMMEVDRLISRIDEMEDEPMPGEEDGSIPR
jgi:hypothetical protein